MKKEIVLISKSDDLVKEIIKKQISNKFYKYLKKHNYQIFVNNNIVLSHYKCFIDDEIKIIYHLEDINKEFDEFIFNLDIIYEDEYLMVINKPYDLNTIPSRSNTNSVYTALLHYFKDQKHITIHFVNRLDRLTRGLLLVCKDKLTASTLCKDIDNVNRRYYAVVLNKLSIKKDVIKTFIKKEENDIKRVVSNEGKVSITNYEVIKENDNYSLVDLKLLTGRTHQIRLHMSYLGNPIVGDELYNDKYNKEDKLMLVSYYLSFIHPYTKELLEFSIKGFSEEEKSKYI